jgi:hypothetical protein
MGNFNINNRPYNKARKDYAMQYGGVTEKRFKRTAISIGYKVDKTPIEVDRKKHIDFWLGYGNKTYSVDVKGSNLPDEIWCEFKNVQGKSGWLYGEASVIAFEMPEEGGFSVIKRKELMRWCEENVEDVVVRKKADAYRKKYTRVGNDDVITKIYLNDLKSLPSYRVWKYFTDY